MLIAPHRNLDPIEVDLSLRLILLNKCVLNRRIDYSRRIGERVRPAMNVVCGVYKNETALSLYRRNPYQPGFHRLKAAPTRVALLPPSEYCT